MGVSPLFFRLLSACLSSLYIFLSIFLSLRSSFVSWGHFLSHLFSFHTFSLLLLLCCACVLFSLFFPLVCVSFSFFACLLSFLSCSFFFSFCSLFFFSPFVSMSGRLIDSRVFSSSFPFDCFFSASLFLESGFLSPFFLFGAFVLTSYSLLPVACVSLPSSFSMSVGR